MCRWLLGRIDSKRSAVAVCGLSMVLWCGRVREISSRNPERHTIYSVFLIFWHTTSCVQPRCLSHSDTNWDMMRHVWIVVIHALGWYHYRDHKEMGDG